MIRMLIAVLICLGVAGALSPVQAAESSSQEDLRLREQKRTIIRRIEERQENLGRAQVAADSNRLMAEAALVTTQTLPALMKEFQKEIGGLREDVQNLVGKARTQLEKIRENAPAIYKVDLELTYAKGETMKMAGYGQEKFHLSGPIMRDTTTAGKIEISVMIKGTDEHERIIAEYETLVAVEIPGTEPNPKAPGGTAVKPINYSFTTQGVVALKPGEAKEITRFGENTLKLTLTPD